MSCILFPKLSQRPGAIAFVFIGIFATLLLPATGLEKVTTEGLKQAEAKIQELARKTLPCTVSLIPAGPNKYGTGSGVIVSEDGLILTAAHVSMEMDEKVTVIFPDGKRATGEVLGMDYTRDAGMIQIIGERKYPFVELGDSEALEENDWTIALGHAGGYQPDRTPPIRLGRVIENDPEKFLMTDSALIAGDSGGPLFDIDGKLIGIHSNIGFRLSQNNHVPISTFIANWDRLKTGERWGGDEEGGLLANPDRPMIGAVLEDAQRGKGARIREIVPKSPAAKAGLRSGDTIVRAGESEIKDREAFMTEMRKWKAGEIMEVTVKSKEEEKVVSLKLMPARKLHARSGQLPPGPNPHREKVRPEKERKKLQAEFDKKMRDSIEKGELQLEEEDMAKFDNLLEFLEYMERFKESLTPEDLEKLVEIGRPPEVQPVKPGSFDPDQPIPVGEGFFREVLDAFRPSVAKASDATHPVFRGREWRSLCTVVHADGYVVTKASEIETKNNQVLTVMLSKDSQVPAEIVKIFPRHDLALLKLKDTSGLTPVYWDSAGEKLPLGSFVGAAGPGPDAVAIGVLSVQSRSLNGQNKGFLGIGTKFHEKGVEVMMVMPGGNAGKAGVKKGDIIMKIDDAVCDTPEMLIKKISGTEPGAEVNLEYLRDGEEASLKVRLGDRGELEAHMGDPSGKMNKMGTELNEHRSGYLKVLQTDLPIRPEECGGPVVDLEGNCIAINIARAGRIKTYALPAADVRKLLEPELKKISEKKKKTPAKKEAEPATESREPAEIN